MASVAMTARAAPSRGRFLRAHAATPIVAVLVVAILAFVAWKVLQLASASDRSKQDQIALAEIQREIEVQHGLEWEAFATQVTPEIAAAVKRSQSAIDATVVVLRATAAEDGPAMRALFADVERVQRAIDRQFAAMTAGDRVTAVRIDEEQTDPAFAEITRDLQMLSAAEAHESHQALKGLRAGTVLGLGGAGAGIVALLCLLGFITRRAARRQTTTLEELRQSQKMDAVGRLAGGVAHDFNNLLTAILGYTDLALLRLDERSDPGLRADIEEIAKSGERAAKLTRQLLALSRRQTLQSTVFDLNEAVSGTESLLRRLLGADISIATSLDPRQCLIDADHGQIEQVVMNLAINARDAMPGGGALRIETEVLLLNAAEGRRRFQAPAGEYIVLRVADSGIGMDDTTRRRAFEPFYTTKELGEGTGLGLATVYGIVSQSGGYLALESEAGAGTTFELLLPRVTGVAPAAEPAPPQARRGGSERILLVEDEAVVRELTQNLLTREGYEVVAAAEGEHALELAREQSFDLVITDMVMPKLSGKVVAERLLSERPDLPIIFISGYAHDVLGGLGATEAFLQKPFSAQELSTAVRASLDRLAA